MESACRRRRPTTRALILGPWYSQKLRQPLDHAADKVAGKGAEDKDLDAEEVRRQSRVCHVCRGLPPCARVRAIACEKMPYQFHSQYARLHPAP
jgi:hypothetical protein